MAINDITGANIISKYSKKFDENFDSIFRKSDDWNEKRVDVIGSNGNDGLHYEWTKHDGSRVCPVNKSEKIEIETWTAKGNVIASASEVNWSVVKYYRVIKSTNAVDIARQKIKEELSPPLKEYRVTWGSEEKRANGYQDASQKALDLYKQGHEPKIEISLKKPVLSGTI